MNTVAMQGGLLQTGNGQSVTFKGRGMLSLETITVNHMYLVYKKRSTVFSPMLTISIPRINIKAIEHTKTLTGTLLKITTLSNNNILSKKFSKRDISRIRKLLKK